MLAVQYRCRAEHRSGGSNMVAVTVADWQCQAVNALVAAGMTVS